MQSPGVVEPVDQLPELGAEFQAWQSAHPWVKAHFSDDGVFTPAQLTFPSQDD